MADITLQNVIKEYGDIRTIHGVDLEINNGEFVVFVGPSGCGKSTLLRLIAGLEEISGGTIEIENEVVNEVDPAERGVAMVFQSYALYPHMTVEENMGFGLKMTGHPKEKIEKQVSIAAKTLQLEPLLKRKPKELSGGQRQRVAIGRAIVRNPKVFLFDEPLSNLDAELRVEMRLQIAKLHQELQNTMVYVTHDQVEAMTLADKIVVLRAGNVEQVGTPLELYHHPKNEFVAGFIGSPKMNFVPTEFISLSAQTLTLKTPDDSIISLPYDGEITAKPGDKLTFGIRPEHLLIGEESAISFQFDSEVVERLGNSTYLFGQALGVDGFTVHSPGDQEVSKYQTLTLGCRAEDAHLFYANGLHVNAS
ncbi:Lactose transport ATP-binding protein lacK [Vibrio nigripulchritudo MADA3029]|uniref:Lactose transport ATP-binding protein lacK n=1 Tax=Vibrio nigripulchritudo TaxID=28173 RepID=U4KHC4_9VIBR|nr:sn-glycerol-3-phosphate ABC transporter ATP-binding protein UgpC [Vibrio nigripulchritudo]EGU61768.1 ABC transporter ATP-binding protein [Vibrio nigripulchritudo ATCC 27043]KJY72082.1 ABC transporter [Vibrio nigripulchritudo]CCN49911.1 Lactose transport ATP-binding protein lacK [Vibrio nigripulchritudo MADA3020]CCN56447.1 Lactose transport ATP-binding protein lacK [Vibrio nigripulchritudo MADA3021]CCN62060.1 Lactose transport ATP-binding protein lacK [Vibrio nigripulchritudo MADA3029]